MRKETDAKFQRDSNIELLRIVLMLMIIGYHMIVHGANVRSSGNYEMTDGSSVAYVLLKSFLVIAVNCFVFISGFYRIKFKVKPLLSILAQATFYSLVFSIIADLLFTKETGLRYYLIATLPVFAGTWWFITAYLALYMISPLLNNAIDSFSKAQFLFILISLTIINMVGGFVFEASPVGVNEGFSVLSFVHIYLLAQFIRRYANLDTFKRYSSPVYIFSSLFIFMLAFISVTILDERGISKLYSYNNPLVFISAIAFFFIFKNLRLKNRLINRISPYVLGIYLFHDHPLSREQLIESLYEISQHSSVMLHMINLLIIIVLVFLLGLLVDKVRALLLDPLINLLVRKYNLLRLERLLNTGNKAVI